MRGTGRGCTYLPYVPSRDDCEQLRAHVLRGLRVLMANGIVSAEDLSAMSQRVEGYRVASTIRSPVSPHIGFVAASARSFRAVPTTSFPVKSVVNDERRNSP
jgi:hypothetical protein